MIVSIEGKIAGDIWTTNRSKALPKRLWIRAKALMTIMHSTTSLEDLKIRGEPPNIRLHKLKGERRKYWSITIGLPWLYNFQI